MAKTGLTAYDEERACPGYVLYSNLYESNTIHLIDLNGETAHRWEMPYPSGQYGYLLPNGNLFYSGKVQDESWELWPSWKHLKGGVLLEVDQDGSIVWEYRDPYIHHDARRTGSGGAIYLGIEKVPQELASRVKGGLPGSDENGMWADTVVEIDEDGSKIWEWRAIENLDFDKYVLPPNQSRTEWTHGNAVAPVGENHVLVSLRHVSTVGLIDKSTGGFVWEIGDDILAQQHDPSILPNGNVLIFDNGTYRKDIPTPFSRVIEVNPESGEIVWKYQDSPSGCFFSPYISGARRLPNGNTLITEGGFGRMFQVTPEGEVVWEYINPHFTESFSGYLSNSVFRAHHYMADEIPWLG